MQAVSVGARQQLQHSILGAGQPHSQPPTKEHAGNQPPSLEGSSLALSTIEAGHSFW